MTTNINIKILIRAFLISILAATLLSGCISNPPQEASQEMQDSSTGSAATGATQENATSDNASTEKLKVAVTIAPLSEFVRAVGGERVAVTVIVPPGAEPHTFEPTPSLMVSLEDADLYVMNGAGLEFWMDKLIGAGKKTPLVDASNGIELLEESDGLTDPHTWLSIRNAKVQVENICAALSEIDPANSAFYATNRDAYLQNLSDLDLELSRSFEAAEAEGRIFIVHHPAWGYFARDYGLVELPLMDNEKEPGPRYLGEVIDTARQNNITAIFVEPEYNPKTAQVIAGEMNARIISIDPLAENYLENMRFAGRSIASSLESQRSN